MEKSKNNTVIRTGTKAGENHTDSFELEQSNGKLSKPKYRTASLPLT